MTPAARAAAAIAILDRVLETGAAADRTLSNWGRENRYAGSKDRRAIAGHVYLALRTGAGETGRALLLSALAGQAPADEIAALFDASRYGPPGLSEAERASLGREAGPLPAWLRPHLQDAFGARLDDEIAALLVRAPLDLRVNTLKTTRAAAIEALAADGVIAEAPDWPGSALRAVSGAERVTGTAAYTEGLVEIQDRGSQAAAAASLARPGQTIVDLCAGAGGKTLALAALMENRGSLIACDISRTRLRRLPARLERASASCTEIVPLAEDWLDRGEPRLSALEGRADCVFVDAPCSGSGTWRRNPETMRTLTPEALERLTALQSRILDAAARLVRPGGRLVYVTCSVLPPENAGRISAFLSVHREFSGASLEVRGLPVDGPASLTPAVNGTDGFFIAAVCRTD